jgi:pyridoxal phosphate enzyme (YggS family)
VKGKLPMTQRLARIADNLAQVRERITAAAIRSGRTADAVRLIAVTKYVASEAIAALLRAGCRDLGESRPQDLWHKAEIFRDSGVRWHLIGHLQRNKARRTLPYLTMLHSADSLRLLEVLDQWSQEMGQITAVLLEVNVSGESAKHGFAPRELESALSQLAALSHVRVCGLMAMAGLHSGPEQAREAFARLRELRDRFAGQSPPNVQLTELSMGMSGDFEIAIEEGATMVRIGSALFDGVIA